MICGSSIVIDNFEDVLELETRRIAEPDLAQLYRSLATGLTRGSRVIITCRYLPDGTPTDLPTVLHLPLPDLDEPNFRKFLRRDEVVDRRIGRGELPATLIHDLYQKLGGTPGFLENVRRVLRTADPDALIEDLEGDSPGELSEARESYYQRIIATRLYEALPAEARSVVSRLAISELPLPIDAVMQIAGADEAPGQFEPGGRRRLRAAPAVRRARSAFALSSARTAPPLALRPGAPLRAGGFPRPPAPRRVLAIELRGRSRGRAPGAGRGRALGVSCPCRARRRCRELPVGHRPAGTDAGPACRMECGAGAAGTDPGSGTRCRLPVGVGQCGRLTG